MCVDAPESKYHSADDGGGWYCRTCMLLRACTSADWSHAGLAEGAAGPGVVSYCGGAGTAPGCHREGGAPGATW